MQPSYCIAIDAMGGDLGPRVTVKASLAALRRNLDLQIKLVGDQQQLAALIPAPDSRLSIVHAQTSIPSDCRVTQAMRERAGSSMQRAIELLAGGEAQAVVSAGNTGALMALSRRTLGTLAGIDRPAITAAVPTLHGQCQVLDLGANIDSSAQMLLQFAVLGAALLRVERGVQKPRIGLLNIGAEESKGTETLRNASALLQALPDIDYIGFVEGDDLFAGRADLVVCDGLIGNVALKSSEGLARLIQQKVRRSFRRGIYRRLVAMLAAPVLRELQAELDAGSRNGAIFLGLNGLVLKSHGAASARDFGFAIDHALAALRSGVLQELDAQVQRQLLAPRLQI